MMPRGACRRPGFAQDRREHVAAVNGSPQVDAQGPLPIVEGRFADGRAAGADTGVVDHQRGRVRRTRTATASASAYTSSNLVTSQWMATAFAPCSVIALDRLWAAASSMSLQTTAPPRRPSSTANAAPIPLPAPVTTADAPRLVVLDLCSSGGSRLVIGRKVYAHTAAAPRDRNDPPAGTPSVMQRSQYQMVTLVNGSFVDLDMEPEPSE